MNFAQTPAVPSLEASSSPPLNHVYDDRPSCSSFSSTSSPSFVRSLWRRLNWNPGPSSISGCSPLSRGSSKIFCRICHDYEEDGVVGTLISPCKCSGTSGMIHQHCLEKWLSTSNHDSCEICGFQFQLRKRPKTLGEVVSFPPDYLLFITLS